MRRFALLGALGLTLACSGAASAAKWSTYRNNAMRFSVRFPPGWRLAGSPAGGTVVVAHNRLSVNVQMVRVTPAATAIQTARRVGKVNQAFASVRWSATSLGGRPAAVGVDSPPSEGGLTVSDAVYVATWRGHVYQIITVAYGKPAIRSLGRFPKVYRQILGTWKFL